MKGSQIRGSGGGVFFIAGKWGSKIGRCVFYCGKMGVVFLDKFGEIGKFGVGGDFRGRVGNREKSVEVKSGMGKKREGKMYRRARNVSYPSYSINILQYLIFQILIMGFPSSLSGQFSVRPYTKTPPPLLHGT